VHNRSLPAMCNTENKEQTSDLVLLDMCLDTDLSDTDYWCAAA